MAIIQCPECGQQISDKAKTCVHCGVDLFKETPPTAQAEEPQMEQQKTEEATEKERAGVQELSLLEEKWKKQDEIVRKLKFSFKIISTVFVGIGLIYMGYRIMRVSNGDYSFNLWAEISRFVRFMWGWIIADGIATGIEHIGPLILENKQAKDLRAVGREKYLYFLKTGYGKDVTLYNRVSRLAMSLEEPKEGARRKFVHIWLTATHIIFSLYLLIFVAVIAGEMYSDFGSSIGSVFFGDRLGWTLLGILLLGCFISALVLDIKEDNRAEAWAKRIRENPKIK